MLMCTGTFAQITTSIWQPPVRVDYDNRAGIYMLTYGSTTQSPVFEQKLEAALALPPYIKGISHYQEWRTLEPQEGVYDWRQLDLAFDLVKKYGKYIIIGIQAGVMAPEWLLHRENVKTVDFVHNNPGWTAWSTIKTQAMADGQNVTLSRMALPWDPEYNACLERTLRKIAERYDGETCITFVNVCGPSVSGGVEANFNVNWDLSRQANPDFDNSLGFTLEKYVEAWKASINANLEIFSKSTLGIGLHDCTGASGFNGEKIISYSAEDQMTSACDIRDYFLQRYNESKGTRGVVRNCGLNASESWWGDPDRIDNKPASSFSALEWEVRDQANIGYECASVNSRKLDANGFARVVHNGITGYGRYLEIKVPDIIRETEEGYGPFLPYRPVLEEAARIMDGK